MKFEHKKNTTSLKIGIFDVQIFNGNEKSGEFETNLVPRRLGLIFYGDREVNLHARSTQQSLVKKRNKLTALSFYTKDATIFSHQAVDAHTAVIVISIHIRNLRYLDIDDFAKVSQLMRIINKSAIQFCIGPQFLLSSAMLANLNQVFNSEYRGFSAQMLVKSQVMEIIAHFFGDILNRRRPEQLAEMDKTQLVEAKEIMLNNLADPPNIESLAWQVGMSSTKLKKLFKEYYGASVYKYFQEYKLNKAYNILLGSSLNVKEVACEVGYDSQGSFSNAFTQRFGVRPSELKRGKVA